MESDIITLNVGGMTYTTTRGVLIKEPDSKLSKWFQTEDDSESNLLKDSRGFWFIDRDGYLFRFILDYLRCRTIVLPEKFGEKKRLANEAQFFNLKGLAEDLNKCCAHSLVASKTQQCTQCNQSVDTGNSGYITVGYQGTFYFGLQGLPAAAINFRKIARIMISGRASLCRDVFKDTLNETRDPDRGHSSDRYTSRFYLKHNQLELAFDMLSKANFTLLCSTASGTSGSGEPKPGLNTEEDRWAHYTEFVFCR